MSGDLQDPEVMLDTLHMAYRYLLDEMAPDHLAGPERRRLNETHQRELGRRLAAYWSIKTPRLTAGHPSVPSL